MSISVLDAHNVNVIGSGEQMIVLAHGFGSDQSVWRYVVPHLVDDHRVVLFDIMGAGPTNPDYYDFERYSTLEGHALDLLAILEELQATSCIYVGHSVSCSVALIASLYRPDLFSKLVMLCPSPRYLNDTNYLGGFEQADIDQLLEALNLNYSAWCSGFAPILIGADMDSVAVQEFCRTLFNMRPDIAWNMSKTIFQCDLRPVLGHISVPCHIIQASNDLAVPTAVSEYLQCNLGGCSVFEVINTDGHLPHLSAPEIAVPALLRHIHLDITS